MTEPGVTIGFDGDLMRVHFSRYTIQEYPAFLKAKRIPEAITVFDPDSETYAITAPARFAPMMGVEVPKVLRADLEIAPWLFDDQQAVTRMALDAKRLAAWCFCGWGKSLLGWEWARHVAHRTGGRVLITTLNEIVPQWLEIRDRFYGDSLPAIRLRSRAQMRQWMKEGDGVHQIGITNYEKWNPESLAEQVVDEARCLSGAIVDENRLRTGGGKQKWAIIKSCRGIEYKLSLTATPAPNDIMEFASQASFLEKMRSEGDIIWTYFRRDEKTHRWTVKPYARKAFFEFMSTWSIYIADPRRYGWRKDMVEVPEPITTVHEIEPTEEQRQALTIATADKDGQLSLFDSGDRNFVEAGRLSQVAKGFRYLKGGSGKYERIPSRKPGVVADLVRQEVAAGAQVLVWTVYDAEADLIAEQLKGVHFELLTGKTKPAARLDILERFRKGQIPVVVTRASLIGYGLNLEFVAAMVVSGFNFSFEAFYQLVRRAYRYGQTQRLRVHIPVVKDLEEDMWDALCRKQAAHEAAIAEQEDNYIRARKEMMA